MIKIKRLALDEAETGMLLAQDVCNPNGTCLLPEGTVLSAAMLSALKQREVDYVLILLEEALTPGQSAALEEDIRRRVEHLFRTVDTDPLMLKLRDTILQYRIAALKRNNAQQGSD